MVFRLLFFSVFLLLLFFNEAEARGGTRRGGKGKVKSKGGGGKNEFSLLAPQVQDPRIAHIISGSHYIQVYKLGFKLVLICKAEGDPRPNIKWQKDSCDMQSKYNVHYYETTDKNCVTSKLEIEPALIGDQGVYTCMANNELGSMVKNIKAEYSLEH